MEADSDRRDLRLKVLLAAVLLAGMAFNLWQTRGQALYADELGRFTGYWDADLDYFVRGYSGHLIVLHSLIYTGSFGLFGGDAYLPFRLLEAVLLGACGLFFFMLARPRAGWFAALLGTFVLLFLGSAHEVIATPYGNVILLPMALGAGALVLLDRRGGAGDRRACLLLCAAVASLDVGLIFLPATAVLIGLQSGRVLSHRLWVAAMPTALYALWFAWTRLTGGFEIEDPVRIENLVEQVPEALLQLPAAALSAVSGLFGEASTAGVEGFDLWPGRVLLVLLAGFVIWRLLRPPRLDRWILVPLALALTYWFLVGMALSDIRPVTASRYFFPGAFFLLLILAAALNGLRLPRAAAPVAGALVAAASAPNIVNYTEQAESLREIAREDGAALAATELVNAETGRLPGDKTAQDYIAAVDRWGSPYGGPAGILGGDATTRAFTDATLLQSGALAVAEGRRRVGVSCRVAARELELKARGITFDPPAGADSISLRRFGDGFIDAPLPLPAGEGPVEITPAERQLVRPWILRLPPGSLLCRQDPGSAQP